MVKRKLLYIIIGVIAVITVLQAFIPEYIQEAKKTDGSSSYEVLLFIILFILALVWLLRCAYYHGERKLGIFEFFSNPFYLLQRKNFTKTQWIINIFIFSFFITLFFLLFIITNVIPK